METLPQDIRNLPTYSVPKELFICTTVLLIVMLAGAITLLTVWIVRSCKHIYNYEYISNHEIKVLMEKKL